MKTYRTYMGRPFAVRIGRLTKRNVQIGVCLPGTLVAKLNRRAIASGRSRSAMIKAVLERCQVA